MSDIILFIVLSLATGGCGTQMTFLPAPGPSGLPGADAKPCSVAQSATGAVITCPDGTSTAISNGQSITGAQGVQGSQGIQGVTGNTGPQGVPGTDAPSVTVVQLCASWGQTSYPSNFPEQALCIGNNLLGVYWNGTQAFLALLPPGDYTSTSPQGCNLTILPNCQIQED